MLVKLQHCVLAIIGDHVMTILKPLSRLGVLDRWLSNLPHDVLPGINFLHLTRHDQNMTIVKELHIVAIVVGTIPKKCTSFIDLDESFVFVVGAINMCLAACSRSKQQADQSQRNDLEFPHDSSPGLRAQVVHSFVSKTLPIDCMLRAECLLKHAEYRY